VDERKSGRTSLTFGVEEEFLLADKHSRFAAARSDQVISDARRELGDRVSAEFYLTQIETQSEPHSKAAELYRDLSRVRRIAGRAAARADCLLVASPCAVLSHRPVPIRDEDRYRRIAEILGPGLTATACEINGCHIHLGSMGHSDALALSAHLRPWLPVLQALSANSPFAAGHDSGCASWRGFEYERWPNVGPAPVLDENGYEECVDKMTATGAIIDRAMLYWYARPSERWPTLEIRVADVNSDLETTVLLAVLLRALATMLLDDIDSGGAPDSIDEAHLVENHHTAATYGLAGNLFDAGTNTRQTVPALLGTLLTRARPALEASGDLRYAVKTLRRLLKRGNGADRQRAVYADTHSWRDVVDHLSRETAAVRPVR